jgi:hypothetical protein
VRVRSAVADGIVIMNETGPTPVTALVTSISRQVLVAVKAGTCATRTPGTGAFWWVMVVSVHAAGVV